MNFSLLLSNYSENCYSKSRKTDLTAMELAVACMLHSCLCWLNHRYYMPLLKALLQIRSLLKLTFMLKHKFLWLQGKTWTDKCGCKQVHAGVGQPETALRGALSAAVLAQDSVFHEAQHQPSRNRKRRTQEAYTNLCCLI